MAGQQRVYKQKIAATSTLKKVFRAMELIAASRIGRARQDAAGLGPYAQALQQAVGAVAAHANLDHPFLTERGDTQRVAVLVVTSDRGMAGAYSASVLREAERLLEDLRARGKEPVLFVAGRRGISHFTFRRQEIAGSWSGDSDKPRPETAKEIADAVTELYLAPAEEGGIGEFHVVFTRFESMVRQVPQVRRMLPISVVREGVGHLAGEVSGYEQAVASEVSPLYVFEPDPDSVLNALMPMYVRQRVHAQLLQAAASELASRQQAMHAATDNAEELIRNYTRLANNARQSEITTEITELISGADALANS